MFRATEAIMKYFGGYYSHQIDDDDAKYLIGEYYAIRKRNKWGLPVYDYHLVDWEFIAGYFNQMDDEGIRNVYSIERFEKFEKNEFESIWKSKPKYGLNYN
ncbi:MAG: hypothetical protein E4G95_04135 [Bacteroidia bacterium]|nr:MAG: hypothetical protein E4G95_04135 [Bacteroidia bacterium]